MFKGLVLALMSALLIPGLVFAAQSPPLERYIVVLKPGAGPPEEVAQAVALQARGQVGYIYEHVLNGFSISVPAQAVTGIAKNPLVDYIETDRLVSLSAQSIPAGIQRVFADMNPEIDIDGVDDYRVDVDVAVLDTGIDFEHPDLNIAGGVNCLQTSGGPSWRRSYYCDENVSSDDDHYHGTHVAGTIAALDNNAGVVGVAPGARLWSVKILNSQGSGYDSGIIKGIDWVVAQGNIEVINMSIGGPGISTAFKDAIDNAVSRGVAVVVAAGNESDDASQYTPAFVPAALTVSALADFDGVENPGIDVNDLYACYLAAGDLKEDTLAYFSNWGDVIDMAAPGSCILSTVPIEYGSYGVLSGTSMAAPHVAGAVALLVSGGNTPSNATEVNAVYTTLLNHGNFNWTDDSGDHVQEPLLDAGSLMPGDGAGSGGGTNTAPVAGFSFDCTELSCMFTDASTDSDGNIVSWSWSFGDGNDSTLQSPGHIYSQSGSYLVSLTVTDGGGLSDSVNQMVTVTEAGTAFSVDGLSPSTMSRGTSVSVTVSGSGFQSGLSLSFINGSGSTPVASHVVVVHSSEITATVSVKKGGPPRTRYWDLVVTNPDGTSEVLSGALTVEP